MSCTRYRQLISRYVDDEVTARQRRELLAHVQNCPSCASWLARARQTDVLLKGIPETKPSDRVRDTVLRSLHSGATTRPALPATSRAGFDPWAGLRMAASGLLLRFEIAPRQVVLAIATIFAASIYLAYSLNILPPLWYNKLGFEFQAESSEVPLSATPVSAVTTGENGRGGPIAVPNTVRLSPAAEAQDVGPQEPVRIRFDLPMDRASVESSLSLDPPAAGTFSWEADNEVLFTPSAPGLLRGVTYTVTLGNSARSLAGTPVEAPLTWQFSTRQPYGVVPGFLPGSRLTPGSSLPMLFDVPMDTTSTERSVTLHASGSPSPLPVAVRWEDGDRRLLVSPAAPLPEGLVYLRIAPGARTQSGETLGKAYEFRYDVAQAVPRLRLLGAPVTWVRAGEPTELRYEALAGSSREPLQGTAFTLYAVPPEKLASLALSNGAANPALPEGLSPLGELQPPAGEISAEGALTLDGLAPGAYLVYASAPSTTGQLSSYRLLLVTGHSLALAGSEGPLWATTAEGHSWAGSLISLYAHDGSLLEEGIADPFGLWLPSARGSDAALALARDAEGHFALLPLQGAQQWGVAKSSPPITLITDRASYLAGQTVNFRALLLRSPDDTPATPVAEQRVSVQLVMPSGAVVSILDLKPDSVGGVSGSFDLSPALRTGEYSLRVRGNGGQGAFPLQVQAVRRDGLSVYLVPGTAEQHDAHAITRTVSVLGPQGLPASGAVVTASLRIEGDTWASEPVTATVKQDGRATFVMRLPAWLASYNEPALVLRARASLGELHGSDSQYADLTTQRVAALGTRQMVSPPLDLAAIARPLADGTIERGVPGGPRYAEQGRRCHILPAGAVCGRTRKLLQGRRIRVAPA